jgi:MobA/MobL family
MGWDGTRVALWNAAEVAEKHRAAVVARSINAAIPATLDEEQRRGLVLDFAGWLNAEYGVAVEYAIHQPHPKTESEAGKLNIHAHYQITSRKVEGCHFGEKTRVLDDKTTGGEQVIKMREAWAEFANAALEGSGSEERIDHRSNRARGLKPSEHLSREALKVGRTGGRSAEAEALADTRQANTLAGLRDKTGRARALPEWYEEIETPEVDHKQAKDERRAQRKQEQKEKYDRFAAEQIKSTLAHRRAAEEREAQEKAKAETAPPTKPQVRTPQPQKPRRYPTR